jgi:hypothetical protein
MRRLRLALCFTIGGHAMTTASPKTLSEIEQFFQEMGLNDEKERNRLEHLESLVGSDEPDHPRILLVEPSDRTDAVSIESNGGIDAELEQDS